MNPGRLSLGGRGTEIYTDLSLEIRPLTEDRMHSEAVLIGTGDENMRRGERKSGSGPVRKVEAALGPFLRERGRQGHVDPHKSNRDNEQSCSRGDVGVGETPTSVTVGELAERILGVALIHPATAREP